MMPRLPVQMVALGVGLAGCNGTNTCDTATDVCESDAYATEYTGDVVIESVYWNCCNPNTDVRCAEGATWWYDIVTTGHPASVDLRIEHRDILDGWSEDHSLPVYNQDSDGWWQNRYLELPVQGTGGCSALSECEDRFESNANTLFDCSGAFNGTSLTWTMRVRDADQVQVACAAFGASPESVSDCTEFELPP